jgi:hypothetical protein
VATTVQEDIDAAVTDEFNETPDVEKETPAEEAARTGQSIEEIAEARAAGEGEEPKPIPPMQLALPGTQERLSLSAGGKQPTSAEMRLLGGSMPIEGQFAKGETMTLLVEVKIGSVEFVDAVDEWGTVQRTSRRHKARMLSVKRFSG